MTANDKVHSLVPSTTSKHGKQLLVVMPCYRPQTKLRKGNVFKPVCQSVCSQGEGGLPQCILGRQPPWADTPLGRHPPAADGVHPTGMHSCSHLTFPLTSTSPLEV